MQTHITVLNAVPGRSDELGACLAVLPESMRRLDGCLAFELCRDGHDPAQWQLRGSWQSTADLHRYFATPLVQQVLDKAWREGVIQHLDSRTA